MFIYFSNPKYFRFWNLVYFQVFVMLVGCGAMRVARREIGGTLNEFDRRKRDGYTPKKVSDRREGMGGGGDR